MRIAIVGSRTFKDYDKFRPMLEVVLDRFVNIEVDKPTFVSGGAIGVDRMAEQFCKEKKRDCKVIWPNWDRFGKAAGFIRNTEIVKDVDLVIAFWDGESHGTLNSITQATKFGKIVYIVGVAKEAL